MPNAVAEGAGLEHAVLEALELGSGNHLHCLGDTLDRLDSLQAKAERLDVGVPVARDGELALEPPRCNRCDLDADDWHVRTCARVHCLQRKEGGSDRCVMGVARHAASLLSRRKFFGNTEQVMHRTVLRGR